MRKYISTLGQENGSACSVILTLLLYPDIFRLSLVFLVYISIWINFENKKKSGYWKCILSSLGLCLLPLTLRFPSTCTFYIEKDPWKLEMQHLKMTGKTKITWKFTF